MTSKQSDFEVAKNIADILKEMQKEKQQLILRWVSESLGIAFIKTASQQQTVSNMPISNQIRSAGGQSVTIKNFFESKDPKNDIQAAVVIAYYNRFEANEEIRKDAITGKDLEEAARLIGQGGRFTKAAMTLNNAKIQGYLDSAGRGKFRINNIGENLVAMALPSSNNNTAKPRPRRQSKAKKVRKKKSSKR